MQFYRTVLLALGNTSLETAERASYLAKKNGGRVEEDFTEEVFFFLKKLSLKDESNICLMRKTREGYFRQKWHESRHKSETPWRIFQNCELSSVTRLD